VTYMWEKIDATNATMADILEALNSNGSGVLGDTVLATATIIGTEKIPEQTTNSGNELPNTEYKQVTC
ncbi:hypothetical protein ACNQ2Q_26580, partial [Enterobacter cloacae complex sp.6701430]|uniref:hypothetical protein n=1 Tax=Enterobacter cloacae complex sp.6701430 TaxID=3397176 RepID=UPI003AAA9E40